MKLNYFECKIRYTKIMEDGISKKKVTKSYLVDAMSFSEAEARIIKEISPFINGEVSVQDIKRTNYSDIFFLYTNPSADRWFKCKLSFITLDEKSGAEKKTNSYALVQAGDLREAIKYLDEQMKGTIMDYVIESVSETSIMDVYRYEAKEDAETEDADPVLKILSGIPDGEKTLVTIGDKSVVVDKTGPKTVIRSLTLQRE